ncbi:tautomerase family protein [Alkalibacter saccharofermentans]|uniref:Tautomerase enzyme n=1 Tax=Alkalibacter saccharofermentans DSM 14828 TaxID=1120975 RepID=A0A1M4TMF6_9FIRM|nr:hypothetical protein [Alkalibacter saccharofermentans]SHE45669.1 hypothetical protein SAMN02746064_00546 [Alkalibacter saccharofermentans DSM 14828]
MPYVAIKTDNLMENINVKEINEKISAKMSLPRDKVKISWEIFHEDHFYNHPPEGITSKAKKPHRPVVQITLSKRNTREFMEELVYSVIDEVCEVLGIERDAFLVLVYYLEEGNIFLNGKFV